MLRFIMPSEKKRYAMEVFNVTKKYDVSQFTGLYFGLAENKITSVEDFLMRFDDKLLYKIL